MLTSIASQEATEGKTIKGSPMVTDTAPEAKEDPKSPSLTLKDVPVAMIFSHMAILRRGGKNHEAVTLADLKNPSFDCQDVVDILWSVKTKDDGLRGTLSKFSHLLKFGYIGRDANHPVNQAQQARDQEHTDTAEETGVKKNEKVAPWVTYSTTGRTQAVILINYLASL
jgi:hypothetical protein